MRKCSFLLFMVWAIIAHSSYAQTSRFVIQFTDKDTTNNPYTLDNPGRFLSQRALDRRKRYNIPIELSDLPISQRYVDSIRPYAESIQNKSKWVNALVAELDSNIINTIRSFPFVRKLSFVAPPAQIHSSTKHKGTQTRDSSQNREEQSPIDSAYYGIAWNQIAMLKGHVLHQHNYRGEGMVIAVLDAGFKNVDKLPLFNSAWVNKQILGTRDFEDNDQQVFDSHSHGTMVFSLIAGNIPGIYVGTAPDAKYWLLRTEVGGSEYLVEEYNWIAAAEFSDSVGVDVINSSLGYTKFDEPSQNHSYHDLDGQTTPISRAAQMAADKGMLVVSSAGNLANNKWHYISAPADANNIVTVGSVAPNRSYAVFSSTGPSADGRVKPEVAAPGVATVVQNGDSSLVTGNGTSFSSPIIAGLLACLWQKYPILNNTELIGKLTHSAHQYLNPDSLLGYGIPDFSVAGNFKEGEAPHSSIEFYPNPFNEYFYINILNTDLAEDPVSLDIYNMMGKKLISKRYPEGITRRLLRINDLRSKPSGIYLVKLTFYSGHMIKQKLVKQ